MMTEAIRAQHAPGRETMDVRGYDDWKTAEPPLDVEWDGDGDDEDRPQPCAGCGQTWPNPCLCDY